MLQNNLIIQGIKEDEWEMDETRKEKIYKVVSSTVDVPDHRKHIKIAKSIAIVKSTRLGKFRSGNCRPISVCFEKKSHAEILFQSKKHLPKGIYVDREYTNEVEQSRRILRPILKLAKSHDKYSGKCKMEADTLIIQGRKYTTKNLHSLPSDISGYKASSKENDTALAFFGELSPFSNFNISPFNLHGQHYHSSEQFIQSQKADFFNDTETKSQILKATTPLECKELARKIAGFKQESWNGAAKSWCKPGIEAKFMSNPYLVSMLQSTGDKTLVEACYNKLWGTGIPFCDTDCLKDELWTNVGIQGEILMEIRETFKSQYSTTLMDTLPPSQSSNQEETMTRNASSQEVTH